MLDKLYPWESRSSSIVAQTCNPSPQEAKKKNHQKPARGPELGGQAGNTIRPYFLTSKTRQGAEHENALL